MPVSEDGKSFDWSLREALRACGLLDAQPGTAERRIIDQIMAENEIAKAKDAEILALKEQVASLQRVLAHRRDQDSEVVG